jgi:hypothetical protein
MFFVSVNFLRRFGNVTKNGKEKSVASNPKFSEPSITRRFAVKIIEKSI